MISLTKISLLVGAAALFVSAGTIPDVPEAVRSISEAIPDAIRAVPEDNSYDARGITDAGDPRLQKRNGMLYCGAFPTAEYFNAHDMVQDMDHNKNIGYTVAARGCLRVMCRNTSGIYVCNDRDSPLNLTNGQIVPHTNPILNKCCLHNKTGAWDFQKQSGGQQFTDALGGGWNVIIGYANCNHPNTRKPDSYLGGKPINGDGCRIAQMYVS